MKKRIFAMALAAALILSLAMFATSCTKEPEEAEEDLGEELSITVNVKITANDGTILAEEQMPMTDYQSNLTVFEATVRTLELHDIIHVEDEGYFQQIGDYKNTDHSDTNEEAEDEAAEEAAEEEVEEAAAEEEVEIGYYWSYTLNGKEPASGAKEQELKDGDIIEWNFIAEDF